eukprot:426378_1
MQNTEININLQHNITTDETLTLIESNITTDETPQQRWYIQHTKAEIEHTNATSPIQNAIELSSLNIKEQTELQQSYNNIKNITQEEMKSYSLIPSNIEDLSVDNEETKSEYNASDTGDREQKDIYAFHDHDDRKDF